MPSGVLPTTSITNAKVALQGFLELLCSLSRLQNTHGCFLGVGLSLCRLDSTKKHLKTKKHNQDRNTCSGSTECHIHWPAGLADIIIQCVQNRV